MDSNTKPLRPNHRLSCAVQTVTSNSNRRGVWQAKVDVGSEAKFRRIYSEHSTDVLKYVIRRLYSKDAAADIVADTFVIAWQKIDDLPPNDQALYWLYATARRVLANYTRKKTNREYLSSGLKEYLLDHGERDFPDNWAEKLTVRNAMNDLNNDEFELVTLRYWEGLKPNEIANVLGISAIAARKRLFRVRARLKKKIV